MHRLLRAALHCACPQQPYGQRSRAHCYCGQPLAEPTPQRRYEYVARVVGDDMVTFTQGIGRRSVWELADDERSRWLELLTTRQLVEDLFARLAGEVAHG